MAKITAPITECQKCGGPVWDNRTTKKSPKWPDFKCKDKDGCGEAYWLDKPKGAGRTESRKVGSWRQLAATYQKSRDVALYVWGDKADATTLVAATATVFIQAMRDGLYVEEAKPKPKPQPEPEPEPEDEPPDEDDDLPF